MIKNLIFDMGHVFLDDNHYAMLKNYIPEGFFDYYDNMIFRSSLWKELDKGEIALEEAKTLLKKGKTLKEQEIIENVMQNWCKEKTIDNKLVEFVKNLKNSGYKLFILSNTHKQMVEYLKSNNSYLQYFDGKIFSCDVHCVKPEKMIYELLLNKYNLKPDECLFIDDKQKNLDTANLLGIHTFLYNFGKSNELKEYMNNYEKVSLLF